MFSCLLLPRRRTTANGSCFGMVSKAWSTTHSSTAETDARQLLSKRNWRAASGGVTKRSVRDGSRLCGVVAQHARVRGALRELLRPGIWRLAGSCACHHSDRIGMAAGRGFLKGRHGLDATHARDCAALWRDAPVLHPRKCAWRSRIPGGASSTLSWRLSPCRSRLRGWREADSRAWAGLLVGRGLRIRPTHRATVSRRVEAQRREIEWIVQRHIFVWFGWWEVFRPRPGSRASQGQHQRYWLRRPPAEHS